MFEVSFGNLHVYALILLSGAHTKTLAYFDARNLVS